MLKSIAAGTLLIGLSTAAVAEDPNINPGSWQYDTTMSFESEMPIPDQQNTSTECVTAEDVAEGDAFINDMDGCEVTHRDMRSDGMDYAMECQSPDGTVVNMEASMQFNGDTASGTINGDMASPMGPVKMVIEMEGKRVGDC